MAELQVDIVTPRKAVYSGKAGEVRIPAWEGEMGVLPEHDIVLTLLRGGVLVLVNGGKDERFAVGRGFVEVGPERVTVLADSCERAGEVDKAAAQRDLAEIEGKAANMDTMSMEYRQLEEKMELARARLAV